MDFSADKDIFANRRRDSETGFSNGVSDDSSSRENASSMEGRKARCFGDAQPCGMVHGRIPTFRFFAKGDERCGDISLS